MSKCAWSVSEQKDLEDAVKDVTINNEWKHTDKYNRLNVSVWRSIKTRMDSPRPYNLIRQRYKNCHDKEIASNSNRHLTQLEERTLAKFVERSPGGKVKYKKGFDAAVTRMQMSVSIAKKRCVDVEFKQLTERLETFLFVKITHVCMH